MTNSYLNYAFKQITIDCIVDKKFHTKSIKKIHRCNYITG